MSDATERSAAAEATKPAPASLEPFSFFSGSASAVKGLGGEQPSHDPRYVFHSPYVDVGSGRAGFTVHFTNLVARRGTLVLYVNMLPREANSAARLVASERIALGRLVESGGWTAIEFHAFRNASFAVLGQVVDETDAAAEALEVLLHYPTEVDEADELAEATETVHRAKAVRQIPFLIDMSPPVLKDPVSQACTEAQIDERVFAEWAREIGADEIPVRRRWEQAYVLQSLLRYGVLAAGASALGLDRGVEHGPDRIAAALARHSVDVTVTTDAPAEHPLSGVTVVEAGIGQIPRSLVNFDLLWSTSALQRHANYQAALGWISAGLRCLRPGGFAVHVTELRRAPDAPGWRREDIESIALSLIAQGHEVARLKFARGEPCPTDGAEDGDVTSFGLIARRALATL